MEDGISTTFKNAANSLALLYKESVKEVRSSYRAGYEQALQDMWEFISLQHPSHIREGCHSSDILHFIQAKHSELNSDTFFNEKNEKPHNLSSMSPSSSQHTSALTETNENIVENSDLLGKRRWGEFRVSAEALPDTSKRFRGRSDPMSD